MNLAKIENKDGILVVSSRVLAKDLEKRHDNVLQDLEKIIGSPESSGDLTNLIIPSTYIHEQNKQKYKEYLLTEKGFMLYMFNIQGYQDFKIAYIDEFERMKKELNKQKLPQTYKEALLELIRVEEEKEQLLLLNKKHKETIEYQEETIIHKEDVIVGLVDNVDLATKRQRITQIVRFRSKNYQDRYKLLYVEFEKKYHLNLEMRLENYNRKNKPKLKNKMHLIESMGMIPQLYELCVKIFEQDFKLLLEEMEITIKDL